jgi:hypothetical protein
MGAYSGPALGKNKIINGNFNVWQRGTSGFTTAQTYNADRFIYTNGSTATFTISQSTDVPTVPQSGTFSNYSLLMDCTGNDTSIAAGDIVKIEQRIEGYNFAGLAQRPMVLSFWVKATKTGIYCVALSNSGTNRTYVAEYQVHAASSWEKKVIVIPASPSDGTWDYTTGVGLRVNWTLMSGSTYITTPNAWNTGQFYATSRQVNACDDTNNNFYLSQIQLEAGTQPTEFEHVEIGTELARCQRYCFVIASDATYPQRFVGWGRVYLTTAATVTVDFPVPMRDIPTISATPTEWFLNDGAGADVTGVSFSLDTTFGSPNHVMILAQASGGGLTVGRIAQMYADNNANRRMTFSAEL